MRMKNNFWSKAECTGPQTSQSAGKEQSKHFSAILGRRYGLPPSGTETRIRNCLVNNVVVVAAGVVAGLKRVGGIRNHRNPPPPLAGFCGCFICAGCDWRPLCMQNKILESVTGRAKEGPPTRPPTGGGKNGQKKRGRAYNPMGKGGHN